jgi:Nif-specific regulatory protein
MAERKQVEELHATIDELQSINRALNRISQVRETHHIMSILVEELNELTGADQGMVHLAPEVSDEIARTVMRSRQSDADEDPYIVDTTITGWTLRNRRTLKIDDLDNDDRLSGLSSDDGKFKSMICCPMIARNEVVGLLSLVRSADAGPFSDNDSRLVSIVASQTAQILANAILLEELSRNNELLEISQRKLHEENQRLQGEIGGVFAFEGIIGKSKLMRETLELASRVSASDSPALILGPTGTGKELLARAIHYNSARRNKPFVVKNCGVKTETLLESELFGHKKGSFTGADRDKAGLFKEASGGTIFLDEIGDAPASTQAAALRVLQSGEIKPVGSDTTEFVDVRIISATNRDLKQAIEDKEFREDLYYRLNTFTLDLPALSARRDDIPLLADHFLKTLQLKHSVESLSLSPAALDVLCKYSWPGNVRQLEHELERAAVVRKQDALIDVIDLSAEIISGGAAGELAANAQSGRLRDIVEKVEIDVLGAALQANSGNILRTAEQLGLTRKGLRDKMNRYGISFDSE